MNKEYIFAAPKTETSSLNHEGVKLQKLERKVRAKKRKKSLKKFGEKK